MTHVFALLDDCEATASQPRSRLYTGFVREHVCEDASTLEATWAAVHADQRAGLHAVLLADYEWGCGIVGAGHRDGAPGALRVLMFESLAQLSREQVDAWLAAQDEGRPEPSPAGTLRLSRSVDRAQFRAAIAAIHEAIRAGETYQVNYTYRLDGPAFGPPVALYRRLRARQPVRYGAFIALPASPDAQAPTHVLSCSPELFLRHADGRLGAQPMKGTARRVNWPISDSETARGLHEDVKNRAENLMIVDLLRNDLGRIARVGSVRVPALFEVEAHATVFQMTSTIEAELDPGLDMPALLRASFPCGSITGAPKRQTMKHIRALESTPRGLYTGAIGWVDAPSGGRVLGDFCLSVAIRTLVLGDERPDRTRSARLGVGAGIVLDSVDDDEFEECKTKARFLTGLDPGFALFETMHATRAAGIRHRERHVARLLRSACALGFRADAAEVNASLDAALAALPADGEWRLRLELAHDGALATTRAALDALAAGPVSLLLAPLPCDAHAVLAPYKTTLRAHLDAGVRTAQAQGAFDTLFHTVDGRLLEGGRSNVFVQLDGRWFTPPVADGVLPGVMRGVLLDDPVWGARERSLTLADLALAKAIVVTNALRGVLPAQLAHAAIAA
ncbi:chorismate-binding protein [Caldimonas sp. KR1-144]|uniref:chorismate-binding protein n=1 Tax=Caldimonas sp. KR1-144 TaxID=3400911 RepID=UPI003C11BF02